MARVTRILMETDLDGNKTYTLQQKHFIFWWWWVPVWVNLFNPFIKCTFDTLSEARANRQYFIGAKPKQIN